MKVHWPSRKHVMSGFSAFIVIFYAPILKLLGACRLKVSYNITKILVNDPFVILRCENSLVWEILIKNVIISSCDNHLDSNLTLLITDYDLHMHSKCIGSWYMHSFGRSHWRSFIKKLYTMHIKYMFINYNNVSDIIRIICDGGVGTILINALVNSASFASFTHSEAYRATYRL